MTSEARSEKTFSTHMVLLKHRLWEKSGFKEDASQVRLLTEVVMLER
jgi:hypothetical protein